MTGTLHIVGTPIGNLGDITLRAIDTMKDVDVVAAEDTRHTAKLLSHLDIHTRLISFHEHSGRGRVDEIVRILEHGQSVALVSDAGMPMISDPGYALVDACVERGIPVTVIPGPSAATAAIALSGIDCRRFVFGGFLSTKQTERRRELVKLSEADAPIVLYESPNRVTDLLTDICEVLGSETPVCTARELTKVHETVLRGSAGQVLASLRDKETQKGEFVVIADAHKDVRELEDSELRNRLAKLMLDGMSRRDAVQYASAVYGIPRKRVYEILLSMDAQ